MQLFSKALLAATYVNGKPPKRTIAHEKAEFHRFKTEHLFKNTEVPKDLYAARLIQHFLIIKAIEKKLQSLSENEKEEINAFFSLSYLDHLWRTSPIQHDLQSLDINTDTIQDKQIAAATKTYLGEIDKLSSKNLLAHFLFHVAGFMHGGNIIRSKYLEPSNRLTEYQIPSAQYDFSNAASSIQIGNKSPLKVYDDMMQNIDTIALNSEEYQTIIEQGQMVYETMVNIYDDLCDMHINQPKQSRYTLALVAVSMIAFGVILKLLAQFSNPTSDYTMQPGPI